MSKPPIKPALHSAACLAVMTVMAGAPMALATVTRDSVPPTPQPAQLIEDVGAAERVDVAVRLRRLTQLVPATACHLQGGVAVDEARQMLGTAQDTFIVLTDALLDGDVSMNIIGPERRPKIIAKIEAINTTWRPTEEAVMHLLDDPADTGALALIQNTDGPLFDKASHLLSELAGVYANPAELMLADMMLIEIAGRQSMLTQKMSKEVCTIWSGDTSEAAAKTLQGTIAMFDFSMKALVDGAPELGVKAAPTPQIKAALQDVMSDWDALRSDIETVFANGTLPEGTKAQVFQTLNDKMEKIDQIVLLYVAYSKQTYS